MPNIKVETEHDPAGCEVCQRLGDWATETDTAEWLEEHARAGRRVSITSTPTGSRVVETP